MFHPSIIPFILFFLFFTSFPFHPCVSVNFRFSSVYILLSVCLYVCVSFIYPFLHISLGPSLPSIKKLGVTQITVVRRREGGRREGEGGTEGGEREKGVVGRKGRGTWLLWSLRDHNSVSSGPLMVL